MTTEEDKLTASKEAANDGDEAPEEGQDSPSPAQVAASPKGTSAGASVQDAPLARAAEAADDEEEEEVEEADVPAQLGSQRFVYAAYFAGGIAIAFLLSKAVSYAWTRLALWKPQIGEPHDEIVLPIAAIVGAATAFYYYRDQKTRTLAEEVASELGKVSWPGREEVVNSTFVVIVTTVVATTFFALMDRFWGFVTNLVYGA